MARDPGDFQTPPALVAAILEHLGSLGTTWQRVLEPTCGRDNYISGLLALPVPPGDIVGIELQEAPLEAARAVGARASSTCTWDRTSNGLKPGRGW